MAGSKMPAIPQGRSNPDDAIKAEPSRVALSKDPSEGLNLESTGEFFVAFDHADQPFAAGFDQFNVAAC